MMLPTHALGGLALALPVALVAPEFAGVALLGGLLGGVVPDLDMYAGHRRTLHYPVYFPALALVAVAFTVLLPTAATIGVALFVTSAAVHSVSDIAGGGLELRPWEATSDRAVYDHLRGKWLSPRRWIRYDGAPEDFLLSAALAVPLLVTLDGSLRWLVLCLLAVGAIYTGVRRVLPVVAVLLVERVLVRRCPDQLLAYVPPRYLDKYRHDHSGTGIDSR